MAINLVGTLLHSVSLVWFPLFTAALATRKLRDDTREIVDNINASVEALSYELDGLLDISKLDADIVTVSRTITGFTGLTGLTGGSGSR